jgi:hypothetical protein
MTAFLEDFGGYIIYEDGETIVRIGKLIIKWRPIGDLRRTPEGYCSNNGIGNCHVEKLRLGWTIYDSIGIVAI